MELPGSNEPFHAILCRVVQNRTRDLETTPRKLAEKLGPGYRNFMYWLEGDRKFPAELLPRLCLELEDYELLDQLEHQVGRVAYRVPEVPHLKNSHDIRVVQKLVKEVGEALNELSRTLEDGVVEKHELDRTERELNDVIRECAHLKHWLAARHKADFPKGQPNKTH